MNNNKEKEIWFEYVGRCQNETHVEIKGDGISLDTFAYKGCWLCPYFELDINKFMYVYQASEKYNVSEETIRRLCRNGKLKAYKCVRERYPEGNCFSGSNIIWLIQNE